MELKTFKKIRLAITAFVAIMVSTAVSINNIILALAGIVIGMVFMFFVKQKVKTKLVDERILNIAGLAARSTYGILTMTTAFLSLVFIFSGQRTGELFMESLGIIMSYVTLFSVALYSLSFHYYNKKYGADEK